MTPVPDDILGEVTDAEAERIQQIHERWKLYEGDHPASLDVVLGEVDDNVTRNSIGTVVDTGVEFLFGEGVAVQIAAKTDGDERPTDDHAATVSDAQRLVDDTIERSGGVTMLAEWAIGGAIAGHATLKLVVGEGEQRTAPHRIIDQDPATVTAFWAADDIKRAVAYRIMWTTTHDDGQPLVIREDHVEQDTGGWLVQRWTGRASGVDGGARTRFQWTRDGEPTAWPFTWAQLADCKNLPDPGRYYGRSDVSNDVQSLNRAVNRTASNASKTLRLFAHPQTVATGADLGALEAAVNDAAIGATLCLPEGSEMFNLELQPHGLAASAEWIDAAEDKLFETARIPRVAVGKISDVGQLAGVALLILYRPLISKTAAKRATYGSALTAIVRRLLEYAGFDLTTLDVSITWPDPLPRNEKDEADTALSLGENGVSQQTRLERLGFNPDLEEQRRAEEAGDPMGDARGMADRIAELEQLLADAQAAPGAAPAPDAAA